jgi:hypothetical protein
MNRTWDIQEVYIFDKQSTFYLIQHPMQRRCKQELAEKRPYPFIYLGSEGEPPEKIRKMRGRVVETV